MHNLVILTTKYPHLGSIFDVLEGVFFHSPWNFLTKVMESL